MSFPCALEVVSAEQAPSRWLAVSAVTALLALSCAAPAERVVPAADVRSSSAKQVLRPTAPSSRSSATSAATDQSDAQGSASIFRVVTEDQDDLLLHDLGDRAFVSIENRLLAIDGAELRADASLMEGLPDPKGLWRVGHVAGSWPDAAWLDAVEATTHAARSVLYRWQGKRWRRAQAMAGDNVFVEIAPWRSDRMLGVVQSMHLFDASFRSLPVRQDATLPQFTAVKKPVSFCDSQLRAAALAVLPSGHIFVGGLVCETLADDARVVGPGVERWEPGSRRGTLDVLPGAARGPEPDVSSLTSLVALSASDVYASTELTGSGAIVRQLFHYDGSRWASAPTSIPEGVARVWHGNGGALWATAGDGQPWQRGSNGSWTQLALPPALRGGETTSLWQRSRDLWLVMKHQGRSVLLHASL